MQRVWAIVLMYGGEDDARECIASLAAQDYPSLTVLLVDNNARDGGGERLRAQFPGIEYLDTGANLGYAGGNNRGIERALAAGADCVLILNHDTVLEPTCVSCLVEAATGRERVAIVAPKILYHEDPSVIWYAGGDHSITKAVGDHRRQLERDTRDAREEIEEVTFATGCALLMPADAARKLTGFAEDFFMYCEDVELSLRARREGYRLYYQPSARLYHKEPKVSNPSAFQIRHRDRNRRRVARRYYGPLDRIRFAAWFYPTRAARLAQYALRGDWERARAIVAGATEP
jgi:GT2 family glycosyltransferase